ncbi:hypothetical protein K0040_19525 [Terrisporobacter petrolearius]|uniref:hypothetical protein n=1 Tax=Terrisporobacter petrolearius TaxID=1460447 RepID=UPI001D15E871|nr:hypothetical protein [Terrisporobacter petrolearius]MCC3866428.1 hypothetical protein [Terrisporobacter petrolearius]
MEATQILNHVYKQEVANAIEQKVLFQTQLEISREAIKQKDNEIKQLKEENLKIKNEIEALQCKQVYLDDKIEQMEGEQECMAN